MKTFYAVPKYVVDKYIPKSIIGVLEEMQTNMAYKYGHVSLSEIARAEKLDTFDTELPIDWVNDFKRLTGFNPVGNVVIDYSEYKFGDAKALTIEGIIALRIYKHLKNSDLIKKV